MPSPRSFALVACVLALSACTENNYYSSTTESAQADGSITPPRDNGPLLDAEAARDGAMGSETPTPSRDAGADRDAATSAPDASKPDGGPSMPDGAPMDAMVPPAMDSGAFGGSENEQTNVYITVPSAGIARVTGLVPLQAAVEGAEVDRIDLRIDGALLASLALPYQLTWNTDQISEGTHTVTALAIRKQKVIAEVSRSLNVDRTPPEVERMIPESGTKQLSLADPLVLEFSEPVDPRTIDSSVRLEVLGKAQAHRSVLSSDGRRLEVFVKRPSPTLPATATLSVDVALRDTAGVPLSRGVQGSVSFDAWRPLGAPIAGLGYLGELRSNGGALWLTLHRSEKITISDTNNTGNTRTESVQTVRVARWEPATEEWLVEEVAPPFVELSPWEVPAVQLVVDSTGAPIISGFNRAGERFIKRRQGNGSWTDVPMPPELIYSRGVLRVEQSGAILAPAWDTLYRFASDTWTKVGTTLPSSITSINVDQGELYVAYVAAGECQILKEGPNDWISLGAVQTAGTCSQIELFRRPGSRVAGFVTSTVVAPYQSATTSFSVHEFLGGTKWGIPTFGVPPNARGAVRSESAFAFFAYDEKTAYDARAEAFVRELPANALYASALWGAAPIAYVSATSYNDGLTQNGPVQIFVLNNPRY